MTTQTTRYLHTVITETTASVLAGVPKDDELTPEVVEHAALHLQQALHRRLQDVHTDTVLAHA